MDYQLKHKWTVSNDSWYIRLFKACWPADNLTFCKLFWGLLFFPIGLILRGLAEVAIWIDNKSNERRRNKAIKSVNAPPPVIKEPREKKPSKFLEWISTTFTKLSMRWGDFMDRHSNVIMALALGAAILLALAIVVLVAWIIATNWHEFITGVKWVALFVGAGLILFGVVALIVKLVRRKKDTLQTGGKAVQKVGLTFGQAMKQGYIAVKTNTCPQIIIEGEENTTTPQEVPAL